MSERTPVETGAQDQWVTITRIFDAPRQLVFEAWIDPDQLARWWGPDGFHTPPETVAIDLRVGGRYHLDMVQEKTGARMPLRYEIIELAAPELLVLKSEPMPGMGMHEPTITRIELHEDGGRTRMSLTDGPYTVSGHAEQGWYGAFNKLDELVRRASPPASGR
jgi:uncharacterized protein YndB with AHSA1/START domain